MSLNINWSDSVSSDVTPHQVTLSSSLPSWYKVPQHSLPNLTEPGIQRFPDGERPVTVNTHGQLAQFAIRDSTRGSHGRRLSLLRT